MGIWWCTSSSLVVHTALTAAKTILHGSNTSLLSQCWAVRRTAKSSLPLRNAIIRYICCLMLVTRFVSTITANTSCINSWIDWKPWKSKHVDQKQLLAAALHLIMWKMSVEIVINVIRLFHIEVADIYQHVIYNIARQTDRHPDRQMDR